MKCPGLETSFSSGLFLRGFSGSGQTDRLKQDRRIQQLSNEGKQFLHWVVEPRVCLEAWWENCPVAAFPITWMRVGPVAFDQLQLGGRTFGGRSLGILMACIALTSGCWFIGRYNYDWTTFWTTASYIFVYNFMQQRGSSQWSVLVLEEAFPENCFGKSTQGGANGLEKPLDEEHHGVHQQRLNWSWIFFADGTSEPTNTRPVSIGGMLLHPAGNVVSYFGSYILGSLLDVFLEEQRHTIFELGIFFPVVVALRAWSKFIMGKLVSCYWDNDAARSTFIRASASTSLSTTLVAHYVDLNTNAFSLIGLQSCQSQQPSRSTIPLRFSPICLRDAERFELVLPAHLSQWGINGCTDFGETWLTESKFKHG